MLLLALFIEPLLANPATDYNSLTWTQWREIYSVAAETTALPSLFGSGPRVRAKILVATQLSMNALMAGEAILRQQISEVADVEDLDRVTLEYLQTEVLSGSQEGAYYVALGISALPSPLSDSGDSSSASIMLAIEAERERIIRNLRSGRLRNSQNLTIASLGLFGTPMQLLDIALDGEAFIQVDLKPWVGVQLAIASTASIVTGVNSNTAPHYAMAHDAFQDLRLRFLFAQILQPLQIRVSDILVHLAEARLPFASYQADAAILELEIHVNRLEDLEAVRTYLLGSNTSANAVFNHNLAEDFHEMEPQWQLLAVDIDARAGELFSPSPAALDSGTSTASQAMELTFELQNFTFTQLNRRKWPILDAVKTRIAQTSPSRVRFGRIQTPSSAALAVHNDGDAIGVEMEQTLASDAVFDPINALDWTLSFQVTPGDPGILTSGDLTAIFTAIQTSSDATGLELALGFVDPTDPPSSSSVAFQSANEWLESERIDTAPFVAFKLTIRAESLDGLVDTPDFFQLHQIRCALVLLLQQIALTSDQLTAVSAEAVDLPLSTAAETWSRVLLLKYRVVISDESQRRGIRAILFSQRLALTIATYSSNTLKLLEREVDLHADGSPVWPSRLPGSSLRVPRLHNTSDGFLTADKPLLQPRESLMYAFDDPELSAASGIQANPTYTCPLTGSASGNPAGICLVLRFKSDFDARPMFLRSIHSLTALASSSIALPAAQLVFKTDYSLPTTSGGYPAPWVRPGTGSEEGDTQWTFFLGKQSSSIRFTFEMAESLQDPDTSTFFTLELETGAATTLKLRRYEALALVATSSYSAPASITAELPQWTSNGVDVALLLQQSRLGGLYSESLLAEAAPSCSACTPLLEECDAVLECRAFSACFGRLLDSDLLLFASILKNEDVDASLDVTWLLEQCLSPSDDTRWSSALQSLLASSFACLRTNRCPLEQDTALNRRLILEHEYAEQSLTFEPLVGSTSMRFILESSEDDSTAGNREFVADFAANATEMTTQLDDLLTEMYRSAFSTTATVISTLEVTEVAGSDARKAVVTIKYAFLGRLSMPFVLATQSDGSGALVDVAAPKEALRLRAVAADQP
ncbi:hypothetical protein BBJ28_00014730 [Nothophytophthora sp. Chile5]|nr:hypothetical protein BBJ28_00014730 [Nothophytophthora sp. Chile5]